MTKLAERKGGLPVYEETASMDLSGQGSGLKNDPSLSLSLFFLNAHQDLHTKEQKGRADRIGCGLAVATRQEILMQLMA